MARPKPLFERALIRVPGELVGPIRALIKVHLEQKRFTQQLEREAKQRKESKPA